MNAPQANPLNIDAEEKMLELLRLQRESYLAEGEVSAETRIDRLDRTIDVLVANAEKISEAMNADFGCRPRQVNLMTDVTGSLENLKHAKKHLRKWMKAEKRPSMFPLGLLGGRSSIQYQPKGVVGVIAPWNFPLGMVFEPLAGVIAAGNRAMIKPSEFTPATSQLIDEMVGKTFDPTEIAVVTGGPEVGQAFSSLAFDHMVFTGATSVARHIMAAASKNLVPVTLELGGKSPTIISETADLREAIERIMVGKMLNAGQVCIAPDYVMLPEGKMDEAVAIAREVVAEMYPTLLNNEQYTAMLNERHFQRMQKNIDNANDRGAQVVAINTANEDFSVNPTQKIPPTLILNPDDDALCKQDEFFGPLLPLKTYTKFEYVISYINARPRPLAAYSFGKDSTEEHRFFTGTTSGGACVNDVMFHMLQKDLPFGGVGPSGYGVLSWHRGLQGVQPREKRL